jgi:hypothetical protein
MVIAERTISHDGNAVIGIAHTATIVTGRIVTKVAVKQDRAAVVVKQPTSAAACMVITYYACTNIWAATEAEYASTVSVYGSVVPQSAIRYQRAAEFAIEAAAVMARCITANQAVPYCGAGTATVYACTNRGRAVGDGKAIQNRISIFIAVKIEPAMWFVFCAVTVDYCSGNNVRVIWVCAANGNSFT